MPVEQSMIVSAEKCQYANDRVLERRPSPLLIRFLPQHITNLLAGPYRFATHREDLDLGLGNQRLHHVIVDFEIGTGCSPQPEIDIPEDLRGVPFN